VENECTSHIFGSFPIFLPKIIKIGGNLTKFWQKQICLVFFGTRCISEIWKVDRDLRLVLISRWLIYLLHKFDVGRFHNSENFAVLYVQLCVAYNRFYKLRFLHLWKLWMTAEIKLFQTSTNCILFLQLLLTFWTLNSLNFEFMSNLLYATIRENAGLVAVELSLRVYSASKYRYLKLTHNTDSIVSGSR